jgi:hypothetical protein
MSYATNSLGNYSGTIISSPIRPFGPNELLATVFSNEIKGGHHNYELLSERDSIILERRDWGMLVTIYNDTNPINNKTYKLEYGFVNTTLTDNNNWVEYYPSGNNNINTEWVNSVQTLANFPSVFDDGYRYLVDTGGISFFSGQDGKIAQYSNIANTFSFYEPTNGLTLRIDDRPNILYRYSGTYSMGNWVTEILNSVRYLNAFSNDGVTYSATSSQAPLRDYFDSIYYVNFNFTSSATVSLLIDGLTASQIFKLENNLLNNVGNLDLIPGVQYQLIYNGNSFQTTLPSSTTTTIGPAEDGSYTDGLYTDFIPSTPIGTAVDRFNELLKNLVPSSGPTLSSYSAQGSFVNGGLSFDNSTTGGLVTATTSPYGSVSAGETFSSNDSYYRLGITSKVLQPITGTQYYQDIYGILNTDVLQSTQTPFGAYGTYSFGFADSGTISLILNGVIITEFGLTSSGAIDTTSSGLTSGISVSATSPSLFSSGAPFTNFQNRTGNYLIKKDSSNIVDGYNYFYIKHETDIANYILNQFEFVSDSSINDVSVATPTIGVFTTTPGKFLSGIEYFTTPSVFTYSGTIQNVFSNTFNQDSDGLTFTERSLNISNPTNNVTNTVTTGYTNSITTPFTLNSYLSPSSLFDPTATITINMTYSLNSGVRRINDSIGFGIIVKRTVQGTFTGGTSSGPLSDNWFIDSVSPTSTTYSENFDDESYRLFNGSTKYGTYNTISEVVAGTWSSTLTLLGPGNARNGLQVINGQLIFPNFNFSNVGPGSSLTNPNYNLGSTRDYTNCGAFAYGFGTNSSAPLTENRSYTRWFYFGTPNYSSGVIRITHENTSFINTSVPIVGNSDVWVEVKLPYGSGLVPGGTVSSGAVTGWLDATLPFSNVYEDGYGCLSGIVPTASGESWIVDFGIKGTEFANGYVLLRITAGKDWTGNISNITFSPN